MPQVTLNGDVKQTLHQNLLLLLDEMGQTKVVLLLKSMVN